MYIRGRELSWLDQLGLVACVVWLVIGLYLDPRKAGYYLKNGAIILALLAGAAAVSWPVRLGWHRFQSLAQRKRIWWLLPPRTSRLRKPPIRALPSPPSEPLALAAMAVGAGEDQVCQVCGEPLADGDRALVRCTLCETPHHAECWEYFEGCSTYGCEDPAAKGGVR